MIKMKYIISVLIIVLLVIASEGHARRGSGGSGGGGGGGVSCPGLYNECYWAEPPFTSIGAPPLVMLVMSKDYKLFYKAYNDVVDLDEDGTIDSTYKDSIEYYGYFYPDKCYTYSSNKFVPSGPVSNPGTNHYCSGAWSGNFLNWATMTRMDVFRLVLYGGYRSTDTATTTVLSRTKLTQDSHSWAKAYNGADVSSLTPYGWSSITLCNTNTASTEASSLIKIANGFYPYAASTEGKQCTKQYQGGPAYTATYTYNADVLACDEATGHEEGCLMYYQGSSAPSYKPVGLMQEYGVDRKGTDDTTDDTAQMYFGLISGSYSANVSGGVLRSNIADVPTNEVDNSNGMIKGAAKIIKNIDNFKILQYNYSTGWYDIGGSEGTCVPGEPYVVTDGSCSSWGNPIGEMLYETIRYFKGTKSPTSQFRPSNPDQGLSSLTVEAQWNDPYETLPYCSKPFALILSDTFPSYDSDQLPGSYWYSAISTSDTTSVQTLTTNSSMNSLESIGNVIIGESAGTYDRRCTEKSGDFKSIRGLCAEEPTKRGAYYTAPLAWYGKTTDLNAAEKDQKMTTYAVVTGTNIPTLEFTSGDKKATIVPTFHDGCPGTGADFPGCASQGDGGDNSKGDVVDFMICQDDADWTTEKGNGYQYCYDIEWDDAEFGWDHELDLRHRLYVKVSGGTITIKTRGLYAAAGHTDYAGYYINGVVNSGEYFDLKCGGSAGFSDCDDYAGNETPVVERSFSVTGTNTHMLKNPLWYAAKYGGFEDYNNNNIPDLESEWDNDGDGNPDTYFLANNPLKLEQKLREALTSMLSRTSSGSAVSILATTGEGEGAVYQAYFYPEKIIDGDSRSWLGYLNALFVDKYGNLREDTNGNSMLDYDNDYIIEIKYDKDINEGTVVYRYSDAGDGTKGAPTDPPYVTIDKINAIWEGGKKLWGASPASRTIYTTTDGSNFLANNFTVTNKTTLKTWLRAASDTESQNIINWVRGDDLTGVTDTGHTYGFRKRSITIKKADGSDETNVWKLGDIVYSTPTTLGRPMENYDLLYGDATYANFRRTYAKRRQVVYVGANDGMLHAFNAGCFNSAELKYYPDVNSSGNCETGTHSLGDELWAFIPRALLPHLNWLTSRNYKHVYYVDLKPKITDVKIFNPDATHPDGWGTILIGGFRYGGKAISCGTNCSASPEYFALDITDPLNPRLLWSFSDTGLGLSMSYPSVAKVNGEWYAIFGSGATDFDKFSNLTAFQSGNVFALKISGGTDGVISSWTENTNFWKKATGNATTYLSDPISVDVDIDNDVDVIYAGENYKTGSPAAWTARMLRLTTNKGTAGAPSAWVSSTLGDISTIGGTKDVAKRITSAPSAAMDNMANLYVYFGSGQFLGTNDKNSTDVGAFYALKDGCWSGTCTTSYSNMLDISTASVKTDGTVTGVTGTCGGATSTWNDLQNAMNTCDGWAMYFNNVSESVDFEGTTLNHAGERMLGKPLILGGLAAWATYIPGTDACSNEGEANVYAVYYKTGTSYKDYVFKEQKDQMTPSNDVARVKKLGAGMPSSLSAQITSSGSVKGFVQQSTGSILEIESITPLSLKSGLVGWKSERIP